MRYAVGQQGNQKKDLMRCVPRDKHDLAAVATAKEVGYPAINPVLPELLEWVQDANWPVARITADLLARSGREIVPHIRLILKSDDATWKFWVIELIVRNLDRSVREALHAELRSLAENVSEADKFEEVDIVSREVLLL